MEYMPTFSEMFQLTAARRRLGNLALLGNAGTGFNSQPPEGGWRAGFALRHAVHAVSTHSRPKAAGYRHAPPPFRYCVSTHSRPKAAGMYGLLVFGE